MHLSVQHAQHGIDVIFFMFYLLFLFICGYALRRTATHGGTDKEEVPNIERV